MRVPFTLLAGAVIATAAACSDYTGPGDPGTPPTPTASVSVQDDQFVRSGVLTRLRLRVSDLFHS